jgi:plasmid maintenance system antidote protein VapI
LTVGEILIEEFMQSLALTQAALSQRVSAPMGVDP